MLIYSIVKIFPSHLKLCSLRAFLYELSLYIKSASISCLPRPCELTLKVSSFASHDSAKSRLHYTYQVVITDVVYIHHFKLEALISFIEVV